MLKCDLRTSYEWLEVSDVYYPDLASILLICDVHLLPDLLELHGVDPFVISWVANNFCPDRLE